MTREEFIKKAACAIASISVFGAIGGEKKPTFDKEKFKEIIDYAYRDNRFEEKWQGKADNNIRSIVESYLSLLKENGSIYDYKIVRNTHEHDNEWLDYSFFVKTEPEPNLKSYLYRREEQLYDYMLRDEGLV